MTHEDIEILVSKKCKNKICRRIIYDAIYYGFIEEGEIDLSVSILNKFCSEDEMFMTLNNSTDRLHQTLCNASQI